MTEYYVLKFLHVIGATVLLGTGAGIAFFMLLAHRTGDTALIAGVVTDMVVGLLILFRRTSRLGLIAAFAVSVFYVIAGTLLLPALWADPLGPMLKIWPILVFNLLCLAILDER